jgi:hypothetical protein
VTINFVNGEESWILVQKMKEKESEKDNKDEKWNKQQQENLQRFGDIYKQEPYKSYRNVNIAPPVANMPLQQHIQLLAIQPNLLPSLPAIAALPLIVVTLLPRPITPESYKCC